MSRFSHTGHLRLPECRDARSCLGGHPICAGVRRSLGLRFDPMPLLVKKQTEAQKKAVAASVASRKRKRDEKAINSGLGALLESGPTKDIEFITSALHEKPHLAQPIASLIRDGTLEQSIEQSKVAPAPDNLGRKLGAQVRSFAKEGTRVWQRFFGEIYATNTKVTYYKDSSVDEETLRGLACFSLGVQPVVRLPSFHNVMYENPLVAALVARYQQMGNRLEEVTNANVKEFTGYFTWSKENPTKFSVHLQRRVPRSSLQRRVHEQSV